MLVIGFLPNVLSRENPASVTPFRFHRLNSSLETGSQLEKIQPSRCCGREHAQIVCASSDVQSGVTRARWLRPSEENTVSNGGLLLVRHWVWISDRVRGRPLSNS
jgi:hypothetical protein